MPSPIPLVDISQQQIQLDFIQKMAPFEPPNSVGLPLVDMDEQLWEHGFAIGQTTGSKKRWTSLVFPFRMISTDLGGWAQLQANPDLYWPLVPWGFAEYLLPTGPAGAPYSFGDPVLYQGIWQDGIWLGLPTTPTTGPAVNTYWHQYLTSAAFEDGNGGMVVRVMQFLPGTNQHYQLWKITTREPVFGDFFAIPLGNYNGLIPGTYPPITSEVPFAASTDNAQILPINLSTGTLTAFEPFTIPPHDLAPRLNCQIPPAGTLNGVPMQDAADWAGWGVSTYLVLQ